jgi:hypothetical protein
LVRPAHFAADALTARGVLQAMHGHSTTQPPCAGVPAAADSVDAEYDRSPAALVYRTAEGGSQVVDLYVCGRTRPVRSAILPTR